MWNNSGVEWFYPTLIFFLSFHRNPRSLLLGLSCVCPIASLVAEKAEGKKGEQRLRKLNWRARWLTQLWRAKGSPKHHLWEDLFRTHRTEEIRWYHFKCLTMNESSESHFWLSLGIREISSLAADWSDSCSANCRLWLRSRAALVGGHIAP